MFPAHGGGGGGWGMMRRQDEEVLKGTRKLAPGTVRRALGIVAKYRAAITAYLLIVVASAVVGIVPPLLVRSLLDDAILGRNPGLVNWLALGGVLVAIAAAGANLAGRWFSSRVGESLIFDLRVQLFDHVQRMPLAFFTRTQTGALISRLNSDVVGAQSAVTNTLGTIVDSSVRLATTLAVMLTLEWRLTLLSMVVLPAFIIPTKRIGRKVQRIFREQMNLNAAMSGTMQERFNVSGAMIAKLFGRPDDDRGYFAERAGKVRDMGVRVALYMRTVFVMLGFVAAVGTAIVYLVGGHLAVDDTLSSGTVVALIAYVAQLYAPMTLLTNARVDLMSSLVSFERVFEILDLPPSIADAPDAVPLERSEGRIEFRDVVFRYPRAQEVSLASLETVGRFDDEKETGDVLKGVSFSVEPGQTVALVGPSGAGKTTIANLIPRLYDATSGAVLIDGRDVRTATLESLRRHVGVVTQDPHLFHDTIAANLRYAKPGATDEELVAACDAAQIHVLIASLPEGYETVVGERGYRLSGGEKQRLAIARVLLKAPAVVILDEATSHLDSENEVLIQRALDAALEDRTSIVIAHRLSTVVGADLLLVVEAGRIVQAGRHAELIAEPGTYADLYMTQFASAGA